MSLWAQNEEDNAIPEVVDSLYREDQFYLGLSFNLINQEPDAFSQNGFSGGVHFGFIRDMPINKRRNVAIGIGLGLSSNTYNSNLLISQNTDGSSDYQIINRDEVDTNRFNTNLVEVPIQFRWRTSTATTYNFWRIYGGVKFGYIYSFKSKFEDSDSSITRRDVPELNRIRYAATLTVGNGSFNAFVQYDLQPFFDENAVIDGEQVQLHAIKFGVEFYFL
jgi:hypothetical protein